MVKFEKKCNRKKENRIEYWFKRIGEETGSLNPRLT